MELLNDVAAFKNLYQTVDADELTEDKDLYSWVLGAGSTTSAVTIFDSEKAVLDAQRKEKSCLVS
jgi:hypothetical protein